MTPDEIDAEFAARAQAVTLNQIAMFVSIGMQKYNARMASFENYEIVADPADDRGNIEDVQYFVTAPETEYKPGTGLITGVTTARYRLLIERVDQEEPDAAPPGG